MKSIIATALVALTLTAPAMAESIHNERAQAIFDQIKGEDGTGTYTK